jgi:hypothetical protein
MWENNVDTIIFFYYFFLIGLKQNDPKGEIMATSIRDIV